MKAKLWIYCEHCGNWLFPQKYIGAVRVDTADLPDELQTKINNIILAHRPDCKYYRQSDEGLRLKR